MKTKEKALLITKALEVEYPDALCSLESTSAHELLVSTRLSAQCTDARVNVVTKTLFARYKNIKEFANADVTELEDIIRSCGLYKTKARDIIAMSKMLLEQLGGIVPDTLEQLLKLPGVGRKTANLIMGDLFGKPAIVTDTHCIRISNRLGLCKSTDPFKVEMALKKLIPEEKSSKFCHRLVWHGRAVCNARKPVCEKCCLKEFCDYGVKRQTNN
jgi:endonuclease-3